MTESLFGPGGVYDDDVRARTQHQASLDVFAARGGKLPRRPPNPVVTEVKPGDRIEGKGWRATVGESSHMQPFLQCYGYRIESEAGSLCYAGDSGGVCETVIALARKADILIHMMHLAVRDRAERAVPQEQRRAYRRRRGGAPRRGRRAGAHALHAARSTCPARASG